MIFQSPITARIVNFIEEVGLPVRQDEIAGPTFMAGMDIQDGVLVVDEAKLVHPGDLLHEAGHLAIVPQEKRVTLNGDVQSEPHEEMSAIAWSWAALKHLNLPAEVVFHSEGYGGGGQSIIDNFEAGRYFAVSTLQWLGMTVEGDRASEMGVPPYPHMIKWILD
jgi:hypothetical protein